MKSIFSFFNAQERKILEFLSLCLALALVFLVFFSLREKRTYLRTRARAEARQTEANALKDSREQKKLAWQRWEEALVDMADLKVKYFYDDEQGINTLRLDLEQIFNEAGINVAGISYSYTKFDKEKINKVGANFHLTGSYLGIKKFIDIVEKFPKFLLLEKIDFLKIDTENDSLDLDVILVGYYEL